MKANRAMYFCTLVEPHSTKTGMYHQQEFSNGLSERACFSASSLMEYIEETKDFRGIIDFSDKAELGNITDISDKVENLSGNLYGGILKDRRLVYFVIFRQTIVIERQYRISTPMRKGQGYNYRIGEIVPIRNIARATVKEKYSKYYTSGLKKCHKFKFDFYWQGEDKKHRKFRVYKGITSWGVNSPLYGS